MVIVWAHTVMVIVWAHTVMVIVWVHTLPFGFIDVSISRKSGQDKSIVTAMEACPARNVTVTIVNGTQAPIVWPDCTLFNFITWGVIASLLSVFGFVGNSLSLAAFQRDRRGSATTLLQCLAASDFMLLLTVFVSDSLPYICEYTETCANPWRTWPYIRYIWIFVPICHMCSVWFVVLIALNRYYAVCRPHDMRKVWSNRNTASYVLVVVVMIVAFNSPRFFEYQVCYEHRDNATTVLREMRTAFGLTTPYKVVYKVMLVNICLVLVPIVLLIVLTTKILVTLRTSRAKRQLSDNNRSSSSSRGSSEITFVLTLVVVVAIICQTPLAVFHFVRYWQRYYCGHFVYYLENISKLLVNVNSSINFVIYCLFSKKFRKLLLLVLSCSQMPNKMETFSTTAGSTIKTRSRRECSPKPAQKDKDQAVWLEFMCRAKGAKSFSGFSSKVVQVYCRPRTAALLGGSLDTLLLLHIDILSLCRAAFPKAGIWQCWIKEPGDFYWLDQQKWLEYVHACSEWSQGLDL